MDGWIQNLKVLLPSGCGNLPALDGYGRKNYRDGWMIKKLVSTCRLGCFKNLIDEWIVNNWFQHIDRYDLKSW